MKNFNFKKENLEVEYTKSINAYHVSMTATDFWEAITSEEYKKYLEEEIDMSKELYLTVLEQSIKNSKAAIETLKEEIGIEGKIYGITIVEDDFSSVI